MVDNEHQIAVFEESNNLEENDDDQDPVCKIEKNNSVNSCQEKARLENFLQILNQFESMSSSNVEKKTKNEPKADKVVVGGEKVVTREKQSCKMRWSHSQSVSFSSIGAMRKETPWNGTLACMLFEERHRDVGEGMDTLWEMYEEDSCWDEEEEFETGRLCCLQAIKMWWSGKMNLGMKISKAIKGFGWLHGFSKHNHSNNVHINTRSADI